MLQDSFSTAVPRHPDALMLPTLTTDTAAHIGGVGAVLEVLSAGCRQRSLKLLRPFAVCPGQPPHLVGSQAKISICLNGWPA
jgi:hypothetical protein